MPWRISVGPRVHLSGAGVIRLDRGVVLGDGCWLNAEPGAVLSVGAGTAIGRWCVISTTSRLDIGPNVLLGPNVLIQDHLHGLPTIAEPIIRQALIGRGSVTIEEGAWVGSFVAIVPGDQDLVIGRNAVIGAGAVVTRSVPPASVVRGLKATTLPAADSEDRA